MGRRTLSLWIGGGVFLGFEVWGLFLDGFFFLWRRNGGRLVLFWAVWCFFALRLSLWYRRDSKVGQEGIDWLALLYGN